MALSIEHRVLLLDELVLALDAMVRTELRDQIGLLQSSLDITTVSLIH